MHPHRIAKSKVLQYFFIIVSLFIIVFCECNPKRNTSKQVDYTSIVSIIVDQSDQDFSSLSVPSDGIEFPEQFPLFDDPRKLEYCQLNITETVVEDYFFSFCPSNETSFDPDFKGLEVSNITISINFQLSIYSSCYASVNITLPIQGLDFKLFTIDFVQLLPGFNLKSFAYSFNRFSNNQLFRSYVPFVQQECTDRSSRFKKNLSMRYNDHSNKRIDISDIAGILKKVPGQVLGNTAELAVDLLTLGIAPYVGFPVLAVKYVVGIMVAATRTGIATVKLVQILIRVVEGSQAPATIIYGFFKTAEPIITGFSPIFAINRDNNPIAPIVDAFGEILEKIVYPPVIDSNPQKDELVTEYVDETISYIQLQLTPEQLEVFCLRSNFQLFLNLCTKSQSSTNCRSLYSRICA